MFSTRGLSRYNDRVLMPTICCLYKCSNLEELYLEMADSPAITTYLLAHTLKHLNCVRVLALPKQCNNSPVHDPISDGDCGIAAGDDDVASIIGINCPRLESLVITGTNVTNSGLSWFLCCR